MSFWVCDFESRAGEQAIKENKTWVWAWAIANCENVEICDCGNTIDSFFKRIYKMNGDVFYFHNLKFDGKFIFDWLFRKNFNYMKRAKFKKTYDCVISDDGSFYSITIRFTTKSKITILDSFKKIPFSVAKIGKDFKTKYQKTEIDYELDRPENYIMTDEEKEYILNDVKVVAEAMQHFIKDNYTKMTIGADCINMFKSTVGGNEKFRTFFPQLDDAEEAFARKSYKGGYCYNHKQGYFKNGNTYDYNSMYPSMMHSVSGNLYPAGNGVYYEGEYEKDSEYNLYIQHFEASFILKDRKLPMVQVKGGRFIENEYIKDSDGVVELWMTNVDLEVFKDNYEIITMKYIDGYKYKSVIGIFDKYIDYWMKIKETSKGALRQIAKLFLNNLYGKFGQRGEGQSKLPYHDDDEDIIRYRLTEPETRDTIYVPVAAFCTSYARRTLIQAALENYDNFIYADTDSLHLSGVAIGLNLHPTKINHWAHEAEWKKAIFVRQKTYCEYIEHITFNYGVDDLSTHWDLKCAGMNEASKGQFLSDVENGIMKIEDFKPGLTVYGKKLLPKTVTGGVILVTTDYTLTTY